MSLTISSAATLTAATIAAADLFPLLDVSAAGSQGSKITPSAQCIKGPNGSGTNVAGGKMQIAPGQSTGRDTHCDAHADGEGLRRNNLQTDCDDMTTYALTLNLDEEQKDALDAVVAAVNAHHGGFCGTPGELQTR